MLAIGFRYYFTGCLTLLFTFPSRYSSTIGHDVCLALHCGQRRFNREFAVSQPTQESPKLGSSFVYRAFTFFGHLFQGVLLPSPNTTLESYNPPYKYEVWALPFSLIAYSGNHLRFLFLRLLRYFSSPGSPAKYKYLAPVTFP